MFTRQDKNVVRAAAECPTEKQAGRQHGVSRPSSFTGSELKVKVTMKHQRFESTRDIKAVTTAQVKGGLPELQQKGQIKTRTFTVLADHSSEPLPFACAFF